MKPFNNYKETAAITERIKIPAGGYEAIIKAAEVKTYGAFEKLEISFDITEGEFKDYYAENYRNQQTEDKKWKGVLRLNIPSDDGTDSDNWSKRKFKTNIVAIEDSNQGYHWDWDEKKLKGKKIGVLLQNQEWALNGRSGWSAQPYGFIDIQKIIDDNFKIPNDRPLRTDASSDFSVSHKNDFVEIDDNDLPF